MSYIPIRVAIFLLLVAGVQSFLSSVERKIAVVGTGYVGLVLGACLADFGHDVICVDIDSAKIAMLNRGEIPIYEPGLEEMVQRLLQQGKLRFNNDPASAIRDVEIVFIAVGTPMSEDRKSVV